VANLRSDRIDPQRVSRELANLSSPFRHVLTRRALEGRGVKNPEINPVGHRPLFHMSHLAQISRCGAKTRAGAPCRRSPVKGRKRCRLHGGLSPGAPRGIRNGNYVQGEWTREMRQERKWVRELLRSVLKREAPDE
jgi:glucans biosynthesis protein